MATFIAWRFGRALLTIFAVLTAVFIGARLTGNPFEVMFPEGLAQEEVQALMQQWGFDQSVPEQYWAYLREIGRGHFGISLREKRPVVDMFAEDVWATIGLAGISFIVSIVVGVPLGIIAALKRRTGVARLVMATAFFGYAIPHFIIAITLILIFSFHLHWLPSTGSQTVWHYIMPTITLASHRFASIARYTRSSMLDVLSQDFLRTARSKGLRELIVVFKHALRNALIPVVTILGLQVAGLVNGSIIVETVFAWPGIGRLFVGSVLRRDFPVLQFGVICFTAIVVFVNFLVDVLYVVIDPRIRKEK